MMDYTLSRTEEIKVYRLSYPGLFKLGELSAAIQGGRVSCTSSSDVKWQASFDYAGDDLSDGDTIRIAVVLDNGLESSEDVLGTFRVFRGRKSGRTTSFSCYGLTKILGSTRFWEPYSIRAGQDAFDHIEHVLSTVGLRLAYRPDEEHATRTDRTFLPEDYSKLDIVNELLDSAGYLSADTDAWGNVTFRRSEPTPDVAATVFDEGPCSIVRPEPEVERDWSDVANVVIVYCDNADGEVLRAIAMNDSPTDPMSTVARGEVCRVENMSDAESQGIVEEKAMSLLREESSLLEAVTIEHAYRPLRLFEPIGIRVGGVDGVYTVQSIDISLDGGLMTTTRARRFT